MSKKETAVVKFTPFEGAIMKAEALAGAAGRGGRYALKENLANTGGNIRLLPINVMHTAGIFGFPAADDKEEKVESFIAVLMNKSVFRAFYLKSLDETGTGTMPDCFSYDGIVPEPNCGTRQSDFCATCPNDEWGSEPKKKKGKACRDQRLLHLLAPKYSNTLPFRMTISPTSVKEWEDFLLKLVGIKISCFAAVVKFTLETTKDGVQEWSLYHLELVEDIKADAVLDQLDDIVARCEPMFRRSMDEAATEVVDEA